MAKLHQHELDLALIVAEQHSSEIVVEPLCAYAQCWVAAPSLSLDVSRGLALLQQQPLLSFPRNTRPWLYLQELLAPLKTQQGALSYREPMLYTCSSVANLLALPQQGCGVALLPEPLVREALQKGSLVRLSLSPEPPVLEFCCGWRLDDSRMLPGLLAESGRALMAGGNSENRNIKY